MIQVEVVNDKPIVLLPQLARLFRHGSQTIPNILQSESDRNLEVVDGKSEGTHT